MSRPTKRRARRAESAAPLRKPESKARRVTTVTVGVVLAIALVAVMVVTALSESRPGTTIARDPDVVAAGEELYVASCAVCHGADLRGTATGPPFLDVTYAPNHHADEAFQRAVAFGVQPHHWTFGPMPAVPGLSRDEVAKIVAYVRTVQESSGILRDPRHPG